MISTVLQGIMSLFRLLFPAFVLGASLKVLWESMGEVFVCWMNQWACSFLRVFMQRAVTQLKPVFETIPESGPLDLAPMVQWWLLIDYYFPLTEGVAMVGVIGGFIMAFRIYRFIKQFVPTLSS